MSTAPPDTPDGTVLRTVASSVLVAIATVASLHALTVLIEPGPWTRTGTIFVLGLAFVTGTARVLVGRGRPGVGLRTFVPTVAGLLAGCWGLVAVFGGVTSRGIDLAISSASFDRLLARFAAGQRLIATEVAPIDPSLPLALIAVAGTALVFLVTDLVVGGLRLPVAAALPLLTLWLPPLVVIGSVPPVVFVVTVTTLLALAVVDNPHRAVRRRTTGALPRRPLTALAQAGGTLAVTAAIATLALVAGSAAGALPQLVRSPFGAFLTNAGPTVRLDSDLDMERNLGARSEEVALTYQFPDETSLGRTSTNIGPLRMLTLTGFDGRNWRRGDSRKGQQVDAETLLWPEAPGATGEPRSVDVTLRTLRDELLVLPTDPRSVDVDGEWFYDEVRDEVTGNTATTPGMTYSFDVLPRDLTADVLRASSGSDLVDPNLVEVPSTPHTDDIRALAEEITAGSTTRYDAAVALQSYFRDGSQFTYSTTVPEGETDDTVWNFLQDREGYCVQFATSMTMMARAIGIPTRLAVGFLPGERTDDDTFEVTGKDSHAWPELYFPGHGWVRFEPTPAVQAGPVPTWADPRLSSSTNGAAEGPGEVPTSAAGPNVAPSDNTSTAPATGPGQGALDSTDASGRRWIMGGVLTGVLLVLSIVGWLVARRRTQEVAVLDVESAWKDVVVQLGALGIRWPTSMTLRNVPGFVVEKIAERSGSVPSSRTADALVALTSAVEAERYARTSTRYSEVELAALRDDALDRVREELSDRPGRVDDPNALRVG